MRRLFRTLLGSILLTTLAFVSLPGITGTFMVATDNGDKYYVNGQILWRLNFADVLATMRAS